MKGPITVTRKELNLLQAVVGNASDIIGLEEFMMTETLVPGQREFERLKQKGILLESEQGKYVLSNEGYNVFFHVINAKSCVSGVVIWDNDLYIRYNIYFAGDTFVIAVGIDDSQIEFLMLPTIQSVMGALIFLVRHDAEYRERATQKINANESSKLIYGEETNIIEKRLDKHLECVMLFKAIGEFESWEYTKFYYGINGKDVYRLTVEDHELVLQEENLADALKQLNIELLKVHISTFSMEDRDA